MRVKMGPNRWLIGVGAGLWVMLGLSGAARATILPQNLAYEIEWGRLVLARSQVDLTPDGHRLTIDASVESGGLARFFKPFQSTARAALEADNGRWQSRLLAMRRVSGQARVESRVEWTANGMLLAQSRTPALDLDKVHPLPADMPPAVLGPYAAILNLIGRVAATGDCKDGDTVPAVEIFDGRRYARLSILSRGRVTIDRDRPAAYAGPAVLCEVALVPRGGHRRSSKPGKPFTVKLFLARPFGDNMLPVRAEVKGWMGRVIGRLTDDRLRAG